MHNSIRLLVLATIFQCLGCTLLVGGATDVPSAISSGSLNTGFLNASNSSGSIANHSGSSIVVGSNDAPMVARSTSLPPDFGMSTEELRAERIAQAEARRQRDLRFAEVQREVAARLQQQREELVVAAAFHSNSNTSNNVQFAHAIESSDSLPFNSFLTDSSHSQSVTRQLSGEVLDETSDVNPDLSSTSRSLSASRPQLWIISVVVLAISGITWPIARYRFGWSLLRHRALHSEAGDTRAMDSAIEEVSAEECSADHKYASSGDCTPIVYQSWSSDMTAPWADYSVSCLALWDESGLEQADTQLSTGTNSVDSVPLVDVSANTATSKAETTTEVSPSQSARDTDPKLALVKDAITIRSDASAHIACVLESSEQAESQSYAAEPKSGRSLSLLRLPPPRVNVGRVARRVTSMQELIVYKPTTCDSTKTSVQSPNDNRLIGYSAGSSKKDAVALLRLPYRAKRSTCKQMIVRANLHDLEGCSNQASSKPTTALIVHGSNDRLATVGSHVQLPSAPRRKLVGFVVLYDEQAACDAIGKVMLVESYQLTNSAELKATVVRVA